MIAGGEEELIANTSRAVALLMLKYFSENSELPQSFEDKKRRCSAMAEHLLGQ